MVESFGLGFHGVVDQLCLQTDESMQILIHGHFS